VKPFAAYRRNQLPTLRWCLLLAVFHACQAVHHQQVPQAEGAGLQKGQTKGAMWHNAG
jgi:hypothetical protein